MTQQEPQNVQLVLNMSDTHWRKKKKNRRKDVGFNKKKKIFAYSILDFYWGWFMRHKRQKLWYTDTFLNETILYETCVCMCSIAVVSELMALVPWYVWVRPVPGLEVASESFQIHGREVGTNTFSQPPLPLRCTATSRLAELIPEMFPSNPPEEEKESSHMNQRHFKWCWNSSFYNEQFLTKYVQHFVPD